MLVFVSYSRRDAAFVRRVVSRLEAEGHDVWVDTEDIRRSEEWRASIVDAIRRADVVVVVVSRHSVESENVAREITVASEEDRRILPIVLEPVELTASVRYELAGVQHVSFVGRPFEEAAAELSNALEPTGEAVPTAVPAPAGTASPSRRHALSMAAANGRVNDTTTVVVVFCDLVESTALMTAVGDDAADRIRRDMFTRWRAAIEDAAGTLVKTAGDGVMAVFPTRASNAVRAAHALRAAMSTIDSPRPLRLRIGIAAGEASHEDGDWFGTPVVEAARLCAAADPDEVLLSDTARSLIGSRGGYEFTAVGSLALKGLAQPVRTYALGSRARRRRTGTPKKWIAAALGVALAVGGTVVALVEIRGDEGTSTPPAVPKPRGYTPRLTDRECPPEESAGDSTVSCLTLEILPSR